MKLWHKNIVTVKNTKIFLLLFAMVALVIDSAMAARIKLPKSPVISTYKTPKKLSDNRGDSLGGPASGGVSDLTKSDLEGATIVTRSYPKTMKNIVTIMAYIRKNSPVSSLSPKVQIYNSKLPLGQAVNQNLITLSTGLFTGISEFYEGDNKMQTQALAFILAHEYAHLLYDHPKKYKEKKKQTDVSGFLTKSYNVMRSANTIQRNYTGSTAPGYHKVEQGIMAGIVASPWIEAELYRSTYAPYVKKEEMKADFMAFDLLQPGPLQEAIYDPMLGAEPLRALYKDYYKTQVSELHSIADDIAKTTKAGFENFARTAPTQALRGGNIGADMKRRGFLMGMSVASRFFKRRLNTKKVHIYYSSGRRVDAIEKYGKFFYHIEESILDMSGLNLLDIEGDFQSENTAAAAAEQAMALLAEGNVEGARKALKSITSAKKYDDLPYLLASADVAFAEQKMILAVKYYRKAINTFADEAPLRTYLNLSRARMRTGVDNKAIAALDLGIKRFTLRDFILPKITSLVVMERYEAALAAYEDCTTIDDNSFVKLCRKAAEPAFPEDKKKKKSSLKNKFNFPF